MSDITEVGDLRDQRNLLIARGVDPNLDQTPCGLCGQLYCDVCPENTAPEPEMNDITQLSTLYSNAIARAEKAEEALRTGVKVKSLDWDLVDDEHWGSTVLGFSYEVRRSIIRDAVRTRMGLPFSSFEDFNGTVDEAKAHCQADYERRILSALILPPPPVRETP